MNKIFNIIFFLSLAHGQNIELYLSLIEEGKHEGVKESLQELISKHPNDSGVLYLRALLTEDGDNSIKLYKDILKRFPNSRYAPNSAMKIGEYFYARGLYTQSANLLKNIPVSYPRYNDMQRLTNLMVNSFNAIGEADSARHYALIIKSMFPNIDTDIDMANNTIKPLAQVFSFNKNKTVLRPYVIQVGAFSTQANAKRLRLQISQLGHDVSINDVDSNGKRFYAVRVNRFKSKKKAETVGRDIKSKIGVDYRVLYRPK
tara:strand:+ start:634 stop:1410 length:777 start_codon:yes stop_codon:yes gene_type:complete